MAKLSDEKINQIDLWSRWHADLDDWETYLSDARHSINQAEVSRDPDMFIAARQKIHTILEEIAQSRHFAIRKEILMKTNEITADVESVFEPRTKEERP